MAFFDVSPQELEKAVGRALNLWPIGHEAVADLLNISENRTYLVRVNGVPSYVLRLYRPGYQTQASINGELAWCDALIRDGVVLAPTALEGVDGQKVQTIELGDPPRAVHMALFTYAPGDHPRADEDLETYFESLGRIAAKLHEHALIWAPIEEPQRRHWDLSALLGKDAIWGDWRDAPNMTPDMAKSLESAEIVLRERLARYGTEAERYGLIHADMRLANLLVDGTTLHLIDFDDCGYGWLMYDFAAAISFMEDDPNVPALRTSWLKGYRELRCLPTDDEAEIDTFVLLRRMALLAWVGSHPHASEAAELAPGFAQGTARLARAFLNAN